MVKVAAHDYRKEIKYSEELDQSLWTMIDHNESGGVPYVFYDYEVKSLLKEIERLKTKLVFLETPVASSRKYKP